jgi:hypothetical protein
MSKSFGSRPSKSSRVGAFDNADQFMEARQGYNQRKREPSLAPLFFIAFAFLCFSIGLLVFALYHNPSAPTPAAISAPITPGPPTCQSLIDRAINYTGNYCDHIGTNRACYGSPTIQAQMIANTNQRFSERGDVVDLGLIQSIAAAPLSLIRDEWGIAIFRVLANTPGSVPGQAITLMVFGNTKLDKTATGLDSFYFSSELGKIVCEKVPMDGILINMQEDAGWIFKVNGTELTLMGNASLKANKNGSMVVGLYHGAGRITSNGQTQYFGAGQSVSVKLGGPNGDQAISPPSVPASLSPEELKVACTMLGNYCTPSDIPTVDASQAQAMIQSGQTPSPSNLTSPLKPSASGALPGTAPGAGTGTGTGIGTCSGLGNSICNPNGTGKGNPGVGPQH